MKSQSRLIGRWDVSGPAKPGGGAAGGTAGRWPPNFHYKGNPYIKFPELRPRLAARLAGGREDGNPAERIGS